MSRCTILFWIRAVISHVDKSATDDDDCKAVEVKAHEVCKNDTPLLFKKNFAVQQVLKAVTQSSQTTSSTFYLRDVTHRFVDMFSIGPVVAAQEVM